MYVPMSCVIVLVSSALSGPSVSPEKDALDSKCIQESLAKLAKGEGNWKDFSITYDDIHPLHGGFALTIDGAGKVTQKAVRQKVGEIREVSTADLRTLVELLARHHAWEQRESERKPRPDESRARLTIRYGENSVTIWEWYNDLRRNNRLLAIREAMKKAAWKTLPTNGG